MATKAYNVLSSEKSRTVYDKELGIVLEVKNFSEDLNRQEVANFTAHKPTRTMVFGNVEDLDPADFGTVPLDSVLNISRIQLKQAKISKLKSGDTKLIVVGIGLFVICILFLFGR